MHTELKTGFWRSKNVEYSLKDFTFSVQFGYDLSLSIRSAWDFLVSKCLAFALTLHKTFGYDLRIAWDAPFADRTEDIWTVPGVCPSDSPPSFWEHLVHGYCAAEVEGKTAWIDVRGITTERGPFFEPFAGRFHPCPYEEAHISPASLEKFLLTNEENRAAFQLAQDLINKKKADYTLFPEN